MPERPLSEVTIDAPVRSLLSDDPDLQEVLNSYVATMHEKRARLRELLQGEDLANLRHEVHQLAGSAGSYGFPEMSRLAAAVEDACTHHDAGGATLATLELIAHIARVA